MGAELRAARERVGWALPDVANALRIRLPYLEALEDGRLSALPGSAYAVGFLRTYADALGLDPDDMGRRLKAEAASVARKTDLLFPAPVPERGIPAGAMMLLAVVLSIGAYVGWYKLSGEGKLPAEVVPPVPERLAPLAEQAIPSAPAPVPEPAAPAASSTAPAATDGHMPAERHQTPASSAAAMTVPLVAPNAATVSAPSAAASAQGQTSATGAAASAGDDGRIVLRASADAWMQVREKGGQVLLNRVLRAGESWPVPAKPALLLTTGNAGGTEILVDGVTAPKLGGGGAVRRDLPLDPELIKAGKLAPTAAAPPAAAPSAASPGITGGPQASQATAASRNTGPQ